jgi:protein SCO1/2
MYQPSRRNLLSLAGIAPLAGAAMAAKAAGATTRPSAVSSARERIRQRYFPDVVLRTQDNSKVRFYEDLIKGKIVTINFFYTRCDGSCPGITANLAKVQKMLGDRVGRDIFMYSFTLKPEQDDPKALRDYANLYHARPGWTFLTGSPGDLELLRRRLGFTDPNPAVDKDKSQHIGNIKIGNEPYILWIACPGMAHADWIVKSVSWMDRSPAALGAACCNGKS